MNNDIWYPQNYSPNLSVEDWKKLLRDKKIFSEADLITLKCFFDFGGAAANKQLAETYGREWRHYHSNPWRSLEKIVEKTGCPVFEDQKGEHFGFIVYLERKFRQNPLQKFSKLRDELFEALRETDLSNIPLYTAEKFSEPVQLDSNDEEKLRTVILDSNGKIPIKFCLMSDDCQMYCVLTEKKTYRLKDAVAIKLLANNLAYKVDEKIFEQIKLKWNNNSDEYRKITDEEFAELKSVFFGKSENFPNEIWYPQNYSPNLSFEDWKKLLQDKEIFSDSDLVVVKRFQDFGGAATCSQIAEIYGETYQYYSNKIWTIGERIFKKTNCAVHQDDKGQNEFWLILFRQRAANKNESGSFVLKLRDELAEALKDFDLKNVKPYTKENSLEEVYISAEKYDTLAAILDRKKNIILQGAPGVGKTFAAKRLAYSIIGEENENQIEFVQFHQNYSYEDFIMGWRPTENNFELRQGIFYNFCKKAEAAPDKKFFFIIDEINRGNMSKIFGELLMLIEADKRGKEKIKLAYNDENFSVPENLFIIGMMNTADRSLAIIDYALRRRFSFFEMTPAFDSDGFKKYQTALNSKIFDKLIDKIKILNEKISADNSLGVGFCIGHSYFCGLENCDEKILRSIVDYEILPMLQEYYFDDSATLQDWENILRGVFDD